MELRSKLLHIKNLRSIKGIITFIFAHILFIPRTEFLFILYHFIFLFIISNKIYFC